MSRVVIEELEGKIKGRTTELDRTVGGITKNLCSVPGWNPEPNLLIKETDLIIRTPIGLVEGVQ